MLVADYPGLTPQARIKSPPDGAWALTSNPRRSGLVIGQSLLFMVFRAESFAFVRFNVDSNSASGDVTGVGSTFHSCVAPR